MLQVAKFGATGKCIKLCRKENLAINANLVTIVFLLNFVPSKVSRSWSSKLV